ncbi:hypothetical protein B4096_3809 [Heyndrickxia coagulans]|nr:hypothetical protein B4096_3809 [Heyndrickxia coagulans]
MNRTKENYQSHGPTEKEPAGTIFLSLSNAKLEPGKSGKLSANNLDM